MYNVCLVKNVYTNINANQHPYQIVKLELELRGYVFEGQYRVPAIDLHDRRIRKTYYNTASIWRLLYS